MKTIFIDESGYTKSDFLNADQPIFTLASVCVDDGDAQRIKEHTFPNLATELKHSKLCRHPNNYAKLIEIQRACLNDYMAMTYSVYKRYMLCEMFAINCISPFCTNLKYGTNEFRRFTLELTIPTNNPWYNPKEIDKLLAKYRHLLCCADSTMLPQRCSEFLSMWQNSTDENLRKLSFGFAKATPDYIQQMVADTDLSGIAPIILLGLITQIERVMDEPYELCFDASDKINKYLPLFDQFRNASPAVFHIGNGEELKLPLSKFRGAREVDSKNHVGIQLADILSGGATKMAAVQYGCAKNTEQLRYGLMVLNLHKQYPLQHFYKPQDDGVDFANDIKRLSKIAANFAPVK